MPRPNADSQDQRGLKLLMPTLDGKKSVCTGGFDKTAKITKDMASALKKKQDDDNTEKKYIDMQLDPFKDKIIGSTNSIGDTKATSAEVKDESGKMVSEITALKAGAVPRGRQYNAHSKVKVRRF